MANVQKKTKSNLNKGFTLLFSILVSSLLLGVGLAILNITVKQLVLTSYARESLIAFYAADSGTECARYHDSITNAFSPDVQSNIDCMEDSTPEQSTVGGSSVSIFSFTLVPDPYNTTVTVTKSDVEGVTVTTIEARGYNAPAGYRRVERGLITTY